MRTKSNYFPNASLDVLTFHRYTILIREAPHVDDSTKKLKKAIRPIKGEALRRARKSTTINLRVSPDEKTQLEKAAQGLDMTLSEYMIQTGLFAAQRLAKEGKKK